MNEACIWQHIFLGEVGGRVEGGGGLKQCWHNISRDGHVIIMLDYKGERNGPRGGGESRIWEKVIT